MAETMHVLVEGDVVRWDTSKQRHCREGYAIATRRYDGTLILLDTYWNGSEEYQLRDESWEFLFNLNDYDELDRYDRSSRAAWMKFHPDDRRSISSQHGLQHRYFVRKGASESLETQIANARNEMTAAESDVRRAQSMLDWKCKELADLEALVTSHSSEVAS